jgi:hypothetical protein
MYFLPRDEKSMAMAANMFQAMTRLRKLDPIVLPKIVVTVNTIQFGRVLCFAFSDGTVQYRDRFTMNEVYNEQSIDSITSPLQVGFRFTNDTPCEQHPPPLPTALPSPPPSSTPVALPHILDSD